jgi:hypothetical protein
MQERAPVKFVAPPRAPITHHHHWLCWSVQTATRHDGEPDGRLRGRRPQRFPRFPRAHLMFPRHPRGAAGGFSPLEHHVVCSLFTILGSASPILHDTVGPSGSPRRSRLQSKGAKGRMRADHGRASRAPLAYGWACRRLSSLTSGLACTRLHMSFTSTYLLLSSLGTFANP